MTRGEIQGTGCALAVWILLTGVAVTGVVALSGVKHAVWIAFGYLLITATVGAALIPPYDDDDAPGKT